jgi:hypothetical protein
MKVQELIFAGDGEEDHVMPGSGCSASPYPNPELFTLPKASRVEHALKMGGRRPETHKDRDRSDRQSLPRLRRNQAS